MTELEHAIKHIKTRADAWAVKEVTDALQSISERLNKALSQEPTVDVLEQIRAEIEHEGAMFPDGEFFVSIDRINEIIDKYTKGE